MIFQEHSKRNIAVKTGRTIILLNYPLIRKLPVFDYSLGVFGDKAVSNLAPREGGCRIFKKRHFIKRMKSLLIVFLYGIMNNRNTLLFLNRLVIAHIYTQRTVYFKLS